MAQHRCPGDRLSPVPPPISSPNHEVKGEGGVPRWGPAAWGAGLVGSSLAPRTGAQRGGPPPSCLPWERPPNTAAGGGGYHPQPGHVPPHKLTSCACGAGVHTRRLAHPPPAQLQRRCRSGYGDAGAGGGAAPVLPHPRSQGPHPALWARPQCAGLGNGLRQSTHSGYRHRSPGRGGREAMGALHGTWCVWGGV